MDGIKVANAPCSWGTLEFKGLGGTQVDYPQMLDELAETGYTGTELGDWGFMPTDSIQLRRELESRGLTLTGAFVPINLSEQEAHLDGLAYALRTARLLAAAGKHDDPPVVVLADENGRVPDRVKNAGRITPDQGLSKARWSTLASGAMRVAEAVLEETGLRTVFHHHCAGYVETPAEIRMLTELTDPDVLGLVYDTGHFAYGTAQPESSGVEGLDALSDRVWYLHFKDCDPAIAAQARLKEWGYFEAVGHGLFCELGKGSVDLRAVTRWMERVEYQGWVVVEQDVLPGMGMPRESARSNRLHLRSLGL